MIAVLALVGSCLLWGTSFAIIKTCGEILRRGAGEGAGPAFGPLMLTALRFTAALPIVVIFWRGRGSWRRPHGRDIPLLLKVAIPMAGGFIIQAAGLAYTTATVSAFLTSMVVLVVPFLEWVILRKRTTGRLAIAVVIAAAAAALMTLPGRSGGAGFGLGEILTLVCVVAYSFQVLWTGQAAERLGPAVLTFGSFLVLSAISWIALLICWPAQIAGAVTAAVHSWEFLRLFALLVLGATVGAMALMNAFQQYLRPTEAGVIYTTEPVFAAIFARIVRGDREALGLWGLIGAALMLVADLLAAIQFTGRPGPSKEKELPGAA
ncbi:MAG: DMT family transporter [Phycisphaerae bacterium]|nr:DMT family transporter [Phycisphaerae bacterium]